MFFQVKKIYLQLKFLNTKLLIMKKLLFALLTVLSLNSFSQEVITNESIVQMKELGFDDSLILEKIKTSNVKFETSISELSKLKKSGISPSVISLMMKKSKHNTKSKTGIYYLVDGKKKLIQPSVFSGTNSNRAAQMLVSGLINAKKKAQLPKISSSNVVKGVPEFEFVFDEKSTEADNMQTSQANGAGLLNWWFRVATNPNEFVLVKFKVKKGKNLREVVIGKSNTLSSSNGIDSKNAIPFSVEEIESNRFKVKIDNLEAGEYCFIYQGQVPQGRSNQSVFDFSVL